MLVWCIALIGFVGATEVTVATLNIGHGRGDRRHQVLQSAGQIQDNLNRVSELIQIEGIDVLALKSRPSGMQVWKPESGRYLATV